jgi:hypothetical protein
MHELSGVNEDGMPGRNMQRKLGTSRGSPRRSRTAKALRISHQVVKSRCACERDGWGRVSDDGPRQYNLDRSEDPWGGGRPTLHGGAFSRSRPDTEQDHRVHTDLCTKGGDKPDYDQRMSGAGLSRKQFGKVPLESQPSSRIGENPPYGMIGRVEETSASFEARSAPRFYPTTRNIHRADALHYAKLRLTGICRM